MHLSFARPRARARWASYRHGQEQERSLPRTQDHRHGKRTIPAMPLKEFLIDDIVCLGVPMIQPPFPPSIHDFTPINNHRQCPWVITYHCETTSGVGGASLKYWMEYWNSPAINSNYGRWLSVSVGVLSLSWVGCCWKISIGEDDGGGGGGVFGSFHFFGFGWCWMRRKDKDTNLNITLFWLPAKFIA